MWLQLSELKRIEHDQKWLTKYKEVSGKDYSPCKVTNVNGVPLLMVHSNWLDMEFSNVEDCICSNYLNLGIDLVDADSLSVWGTCSELGYKNIMSYGVTDSYESGTDCIINLLKHYPELEAYGNSAEGKFAIIPTKVTDDFRFHKSGGYRGNGQVGEHVYDSPDDSYLTFTIVRLVEDK